MPSLREYQESDVRFLKAHTTACCFNDPRTGKTPTILHTLINPEIHKFIIVCPASAINVWIAEMEVWRPNIPYIALTGTAPQKSKKLSTWETGALIISYDTLKQTTRSQGFVDQVLKHQPDAVVLDEAHRIKNYNTSTAKAAFKLMKIKYRYALTGTPAPNKPHEVWSILHFVRPGLFPAYWSFIKEYFYTFKRNNNYGTSFIDICDFKPGKDKQLQRTLDTFCTQRKRKDVMPWLPDKDKQIIKLEPTTEQKRYLHELLEYFETDTLITQGILDRIVRYRQICATPELVGLKGKSPKIEWLLQFIQDYPEKQILVFSKFTQFLHLISKHLTTKKCAHSMIVGKTPIPTRQTVIKDFQQKKANILLLNIDAGKEALTLDTADTIIFMDQFPPVADIIQAEDRFVATTPEKKDKPHTIYNLLMKSTYDEQIYQLLKKNKTATDIINDFKNALNRKEREQNEKD